MPNKHSSNRWQANICTKKYIGFKIARKTDNVEHTDFDKQRNCLIILSESASFPWGMAATSRVRNLAKAALIDGWSVEYVGLRGADTSKRKGKEYKPCGCESGIFYRYPGGFTVRPKNWLIRRVDDTLGCLFTIIYFLIKRALHNADVVIFYSRNENITGFWIPILHFLKIPVILEMCEWPLAIAKVNDKYRKKAKHFCLKIVPKADGFLPISTYINKEIARVVSYKQRDILSFQIPILIDFDKRMIENEKISNCRYILYCGSISYVDIAMVVVDIVHELKIRGNDLWVKITGEVNAASKAKFKSYAEQKGVFNRFKFTGFLEEKELFDLMRQATCLLAPLPYSLQSKSRFPTKIGYYLASSTPLVTNLVGDIKLYLQDQVNAFVTSKCDSVQFAGKIEMIINDPELAKKIAAAGREMAFDKFHYTKACEGFGDFVQKVVNEYKRSLSYN